MLPKAIRNISPEDLADIPMWSSRLAGLYCELRDSKNDALAITLREVKKILRRCQLLSGQGIAALPEVVTQFLTDRSAGDDRQQQVELQELIAKVRLMSGLASKAASLTSPAPSIARTGCRY